MDINTYEAVESLLEAGGVWEKYYWAIKVSKGQHHREDGPAVIFPDGIQWWFLNGQCHRVDGPAIIHADGSQWWFLNGLRHRVDGPAIIRADGMQEWWLEGKQIT